MHRRDDVPAGRGEGQYDAIQEENRCGEAADRQELRSFEAGNQPFDQWLASEHAVRAPLVFRHLLENMKKAKISYYHQATSTQ
jgi:hypothetical protein